MRRLPRPSESGCRIFDGPQLKEKCLKDAVFGRLALIHIWIKSWVGFGDHKCIAEELGGAFLSISPQPKSSNLGKQYFFRFDLNWICFGNMNSDFFWPFKASKLPILHIYWHCLKPIAAVKVNYWEDHQYFSRKITIFTWWRFVCFFEKSVMFIAV